MLRTDIGSFDVCKIYFFRFFQHLFCIYLEGMSELTSLMMRVFFQVFFRQNPRSLIYFEFREYLLWVQAIEVNSLVVSSKRIQRYSEVNKSLPEHAVLKLAVDSENLGWCDFDNL